MVLFNQGLVEKQLFITDERVTLIKYISKQKNKFRCRNHNLPVTNNRFGDTNAIDTLLSCESRQIGSGGARGGDRGAGTPRPDTSHDKK